jgi:hypothetical protein
VNEDQREAWRKALADKAAQGRRQRYRPRAGLLNVRGAGMVRVAVQRNNGRRDGAR